MRTSIIAILSNLELPKEYKRMKYFGMNIEKEGANIRGVRDEEFINTIGSFNFRDLRNTPCLYQNIDIEMDSRRLIKMSEEMLRVRGFVQQVLFSFWLIKDNSINSNLIISRMEDNYTANNRATLMYSEAQGVYNKTLFSKEELQESLQWFPLLFTAAMESTYAHDEVSEEESDNLIYINSDKNLPYTDFNRLQRMIRFIHLARSESFLPAKITFYISSLEALLSTSNIEVKMQVADRSARVLGKTYDERIRINKAISIAYSFRSNYIHGAVNNPKTLKKSLKFFSSVEELSIELDNIIRRMLKLFLTDLNHVIQMNDEKFAMWVNELLYK